MNSEQIPIPPFSEHELREQWNQQADELNQWDSLDSSEQLAWAQARALQSVEPAPLADEGLAKLIDKLGWIAAQLGALGWEDDDATVRESASLLQRQQARIIELEKRLEGLKPAPASERLRRCPTHGQQPATSWGCPECVRELREQLAAQALQPVPLQWSENKAPCKECRYDHCVAETPFGRFLVTWNWGGWKELKHVVVDETPWGDYFGTFNSIENAKMDCQREMDKRLADCFRAYSIQPVPVGERLPGPEDCIRRDDDDWCWGQERSVLTGGAAFRWRLMRVSALVDEAVNWLPAHCLPIPQEES